MCSRCVRTRVCVCLNFIIMIVFYRMMIQLKMVEEIGKKMEEKGK